MRQRYKFFIGIDMSKLWFDAALTLDGDQAQMVHEQFENTKTGFKAFLKWLRLQAGKRKIDTTFVFCMEHTGIYTLPLCQFLQQQQLAFTLVSGLAIKLSLGIRRGKSDKSDAKDIAQYTYEKRKALKISTLPIDELLYLRNLLSYRARLVKYKVGLGVAAKELAQFAPKNQCELVVNDTKQLVKNMDKRIEKVERQMREVIKGNQQLESLYKLVISVKSVGPIIASTMLVYTNAFTAFDNCRKFACYCSLAPFKEQSGTSIKTEAKVNPLGYRKIKTLLTNGAQSAVNHDKELRAYFIRKTAEGKHENVVLNAIKFKLVARIFAVVKRGTPWVEKETFRA